MRIYCTLFDINYLPKGLALYHSLIKHAKPFHLYILALDDETFWLLDTMKLDSVTVLPLQVLESRMKLESVKSSRNWMEYCWTLASQLMYYLTQVTSPLMITYLDSDLYFFSSPEPIFDELGSGSIAIIPHRFHRGNLRLAVNGIYNVGWLTIKCDHVGMQCLTYWASQCRDWCYHRNEDGKFGDQAYLDSWPYDYGPACRVITNIGAGLAPWNVMSYRVARARHLSYEPNTAELLVEDSPTKEGERQKRYLVFYHFHEFTHDADGNCTRTTRHPHTHTHRNLIYDPYIAAIKDAVVQIKGATNVRLARLAGSDRA